MLTTILSVFAATGCEKKSFFLLPTWYEYLLTAEPPLLAYNEDTGRCEFVDSLKFSDLSLIALALVDIALRIAALAAVAYVIYGGVQFVTAQGEADKVKKARQTIINALIGLAIALVSTGIVAFIGTRVG